MSNLEFCRLIVDPINRRLVREDTRQENTAQDWLDDPETRGAVRCREIDPFDPFDPEMGLGGGASAWSDYA